MSTVCPVLSQIADKYSTFAKTDVTQGCDNSICNIPILKYITWLWAEWSLNDRFFILKYFPVLLQTVFTVLYLVYLHSALKNKDFEISERGEIEVKGKGKMTTYFLVQNLKATEDDIMGRAAGDPSQLHQENEETQDDSHGKHREQSWEETNTCKNTMRRCFHVLAFAQRYREYFISFMQQGFIF